VASELSTVTYSNVAPPFTSKTILIPCFAWFPARRISLVMELDEGKQFRVGKVEVFGLEPSKAAALTSRVKPRDVFQYSLVEAFVKANIPAFLDVTSSEVLDLRKRQRDGIVDIVVNFRWLPKQE
jgi:outer membrane protein assembly factor BamA